MSGLKNLFDSDVPRWACELTSTHVIVVHVGADRQKILSHSIVELSPGDLSGDLRESKQFDSLRIRKALYKALDQAGFSGTEIAMVVPDGMARTSIISADNFPKDSLQQKLWISWKLKKKVPFDIETARMAYSVFSKNGSFSILVALSPTGRISQYEDLLEPLGVHVGIVSLSTLSALNLVEQDCPDTLFVKVNEGSVTTSLLMQGDLRFYRNVDSRVIYDAVYPTVMYYEDKLGGTGIKQVITCANEGQSESVIKQLSQQLSMPSSSLYSSEISDFYKPALGVVQL